MSVAPSHRDALAELKNAADDARRSGAFVLGECNVRHTHHARLCTTVLRAFGQEPSTSFFFEPLAISEVIVPRADVILASPKIGVLVIENKGVGMNQLAGVAGTTLRIRRQDRVTEEDPFYQAEQVVHRLQDALRKSVSLDQALFIRTAALPRIIERSFVSRFGCRWPEETLFAEAVEDVVAFRTLLYALSDRELQRSGKAVRLSEAAQVMLRCLFDGTAIVKPSRPMPRRRLDPTRLGARLHQVESRVNQLTTEQADANRMDVVGQHRLLRGVAGSGKSVLLCAAVARTYRTLIDQGGLFSASPTVLVTCYNRTLVPFLRGKIDTAMVEHHLAMPAEDSLLIAHFHSLIAKLGRRCPALKVDLEPELKGDERFLEFGRRFEAAWDALPAETAASLQFDAVFVDESQDLAEHELRILRKLARQTLFICYDDAQNVYAKKRPIWSDLGINVVGGRSLVLTRCIRNTRQILKLAFNVLLGSFTSEQVETRQFAGVAELKEKKLVLPEGAGVDVRFAEREGEWPTVRAFADQAAEHRFVAKQIEDLIFRDEVQPSDILVLFNSERNVQGLRAELAMVMGREFGRVASLRCIGMENGDSKDDLLLQPDQVTASTIHSAKGYDAPIVFIVGTHHLKTSVRDRALFYVAATRAKHRLYVTGVEGRPDSLFHEVCAADAGLIR